MKKLYNPIRLIQRSPVCAEITAAMPFVCEYPAITGVKDNMIIINFGDWEEAAITRNVTNPQIIEDIVLAGAAVGYLYEGVNGSHQPSAKYIKKTYGGNYDHIVKFLVLNYSPAIKLQAEKLMKGRYVAVIENNQKNANGDGALEVYGADIGLIGINCDHDTQSDENAGLEIVLGSPEKSKEPHLPQSIFDTDYATSKAVFTALV